MSNMRPILLKQIPALKRIHYIKDPDGSQMGSHMGPIWATHMGVTYDCATGYHMGPIWVAHMG